MGSPAILMAIFLGTGLALALLLLGSLIVVSGTLLDRIRHPAPGQLVQVGGQKLHLLLTGEDQPGRPVVVLECGLASSSVSWTPVRRQMPESVRVASYDRAGYGWSQGATAPRTVKQINHELFALLDQAAPGRPMILVGHSFGGMSALYAACTHSDRVAGLVLVDPLHPAEWLLPEPPQKAGLERSVKLAEGAAILARWGILRMLLRVLTWMPGLVPRRWANRMSGRGGGALERLLGEIRKLPREQWPVIRSHWSLEKNYLSIADHIRNLPLSSAQTANAMRRLDLPVVVLTAGFETFRRHAHQLLSELSPAGRLVVAERSGHWIQLDQPELVVRSVLEILQDLGWEN